MKNQVRKYRLAQPASTTPMPDAKSQTTPYTTTPLSPFISSKPMFYTQLRCTPNCRSPTAQSDPHYTTTRRPSPPSQANHTAKAPNVPAQGPTASSHPPSQASRPDPTRGTRDCSTWSWRGASSASLSCDSVLHLSAGMAVPAQRW